MLTKTPIGSKRKEVDRFLEQFRGKTGSHQLQPRWPSPSTIETKNEVLIAEDEIAIIGMAGRFPDSPDLESFWENLKAGRHLVHQMPSDRWSRLEAGGDPNTDDLPPTVNHIGSISNIFRFDARLFGISPREAEAMDPHQRVLLEVIWATLEQAGYAPARLSGTKTGVFMAMYNPDFLAYSQKTARDKASQPYLATGAGSLISNRISYLFNLHGPSEIVSTACSSALVALHKAGQAIRAGDCTMALVGGVSLLLSPERLQILSRLGILSTVGYCAPFDPNSPGEVMGEGVGAVLLKPLSQARRDGDTIYALLKATGTNHHGNVSGSFTMPSVQAQRELIVDTYRRAQIDPRTIGFIEAHGSGNISGDAVEIRAFDQAFATLAQDQQAILAKQFCGIGSGKGNTGFLEAAGGMAQLFKVILAMQQRTLPATINFKSTDETLHLEQSPFYIVDKTHPWEALRDEKGQALPRRGALNAYGLGGTNAHIVLEEYVQPESERRRRETTVDTPQLIVLSAKNEDQLREMVNNLLLYLNRQPQFALHALASIAYTLQVGRAALEHRLAFIVTDLGDLRAKLAIHLAGEGEIEHRYEGKAEKEQIKVNAFAQDEDLQEIVIRWLIKGKLVNVAQLWVSGVEIDWRWLYPDQTPQRVSLPTYPFAGERYWISPDEPGRMNNEKNNSSFILHPLVHRNISTFTGQRYSTTLTGAEFFLNDHRVRGEKVLPGVAYLEMARAAGAMAVSDASITQLREVVWVRPLVVKDKPVEVDVDLHLDERDEIGFAVSSHYQQERVVFCQGKLATAEASLPPPLDIQAIQARCQSEVSGADCYSFFREQGMAHGPALQGMVHLSYNEREALAQLRLPAAVPREGYSLHPSLLDAALQATIGLVISQHGQKQPSLYLPFALQGVDIYNALPDNVYAYARYNSGVEPSGRGVKYDITLTDAQGAICVTLHGFTARAVAGLSHADVLYFSPDWQVKPLADGGDDAGQAPTANTLLLIGLEPALVEAIAATFDEVEVLSLPEVGTDMAETVSSLLQTSWAQLKGILQERSTQSAHQILVVAVDTVERYLYAPLAGLLRTARLEQPYLRGKVITVASPDKDTLLSLLSREMSASSFREVEVRYDAAGIRTVKTLREIEVNGQVPGAYLKPGGVYWITGGLGGLGRIFARHLLERGDNITIILSGRSKLDETGRQHLVALNQAGGTVAYLPADVGVKADVERVVRTIRTEYGPLSGILHSAGIIKDNSLVNKTESEIAAVLAPKVSGILHIDAATRFEPLDFMVLFSSLAGVLGQSGVADYVSANLFLDSFAHHRQTLVETGQRAGRTLSINWPLWAEGKMVTIDVQSLATMAHLTGMTALATEAGLQAFELVMASTQPQVVVAVGTADKLRHRLLPQSIAPSEDIVPLQPGTNVDGLLREKIQADLTRVVATLLKVSAQDLATDEPLNDYGFTSIALTEFANQLNETYNLDLMPTVFFEYNTLASVSGHLAENYMDILEQHYRVESDSKLATFPQGTPSIPVSNARFRPAKSRLALPPDDSEKVAGHSPLVTFRSTGSRPPFFCVHPWAGMVYPYSELATGLGPDQPFYGLQAAGLYQEPHTSIEAMAGYYLSALRAVQPAPPYLLGGWSLGGPIAFEMAQQLQRAGETVALLALFDAPAPIHSSTSNKMALAKFLATEAGPYIWPYIFDYVRLKASLLPLTDIPDDPIDKNKSNFLSRGWWISRTVAKEIYSLTSSQSTARRILAILKASRLALSIYEPQPYSGRVTLFRVLPSAGPNEANPTLGWSQLVEPEVAVHYVPGHHFNLMKKPHVQVLASQMKIYIDQIQSK